MVAASSREAKVGDSRYAHEACHNFQSSSGLNDCVSTVSTGKQPSRSHLVFTFRLSGMFLASGDVWEGSLGLISLTCSEQFGMGAGNDETG